MKKTFKETKFGKILSSPVAKSLLTKIPFGVGSMIGDAMTSNESPQGVLNREQLANNLVKIGIYVVLIYLVLSGKIGWDEAEAAKEFVQP